MKKERSNQRSTSSLSLAGRGRGGDVGADPTKIAPASPSPALLHKGEENTITPARNDFVLVGEFGRAHGLRGEVRLKSFTGDPAAIANYNPLVTAQGRKLALKNVRPAAGAAPDMLIARIEGVASREAAEALNRVQLFLERSRLPPPEEEDEFLLADLIGLAVEDETGAPVGTIVAVPNYGGGDLLEIKSARTGAVALLPFTKAFVPLVDIAAKRVVAALPEDFFARARPGPGDEA